MADFTRFISYLYDYRAGERNRNLGFAKVESRQGMCRLTVCLNHGQVVQRDMMLCGYIAEENEVYLVRLGEMERGMRERQWRFPADNLGNCGVGLERLSGLILLNEERSFFLLSVWNDSRWTAEDIRGADFTERERAGQQEPLGVYAYPVDMSGSAGAVLMAAEEESTTAETSAAEKKVTEPRAAGKREAETMAAERHTPEVRETASEERASVQTKWGEDDGAYHDRYQSDSENDRHVMLSVAPDGAAQVAVPAPVAAPTNSQTGTSAAPEGWRILCKLFPAARPFEPSAWEVLCISLQDIGRLPPENWVWGNNHFLLHGFYQYHHLILARNRVENRIYLGVPGEFGTNEKFMAAMFGLHQFQRERQGKSEKGYWLTPVRL